MHICCYGEEARLPESLARCQAHPTPVTAGPAARSPGPGGAWARTPSTFHAWSSGPLCPSVSLCLALISPSLSPTPLPPSFSSLGLRLPGCLAAWLSLIARPSWLLSRFLSSSSPDLRSVWSSILLPLSSLCLSALGGPPPSSLPISLPFKCKQEGTAVHRSGDPPTLGCQGAGAQEGLRAHYPNGICGGRPAGLGNGPLKPSGANGGFGHFPLLDSRLR